MTQNFVFYTPQERAKLAEKRKFQSRTDQDDAISADNKRTRDFLAAANVHLLEQRNRRG